MDARKLGRLENRVNRVFDDTDIQKIAATYHSWKQDEDAPGKVAFEDIPGFCKSAGLEEVRLHDYILTPGRYVGAEIPEDDDEEFAAKMVKLTNELAAQFEESSRLEGKIKESLKSIGIGF